MGRVRIGQGGEEGCGRSRRGGGKVGGGLNEFPSSVDVGQIMLGESRVR